jgi:hypothetical protein
MFDEKTILARLQNGEDAQAIANEMAAMINTANKMYADQQKAKEEAAKAAAKKAEIQKKEDLQEILDDFMLWLNEYYNVEEEVTADQVIELIDSIQEYVKAMTDLGTLFHAKKPAAPVGTKAIKQTAKPKNADDTLHDFLKQMGW